MRKIFCFIGSRANYSSIKSVLKEIKKKKHFKLFLIVGASAVLDKYGSVDKLIEKDGFDIYKKVFFLIEGESPLTMSKSTGLGLIEMSSLINEINPDIVLTIGSLKKEVRQQYVNYIEHTNETQKRHEDQVEREEAAVNLLREITPGELYFIDEPLNMENDHDNNQE